MPKCSTGGMSGEEWRRHLLKRNAEKARKRRANLTEEERAKERKEHVERARKRNAQYSEEERIRRRRENTESARKRRAQLTEEELLLLRKKHAKNQRQRLAHLSEEEHLRRRERNAKNQRQRLRRAQLSEVEHLLRRKENAEAQRQRRWQLSEEELAKVRKEDAERQKERRAKLSEEELARERGQRAALDRERRENKKEYFFLHRAADTVKQQEQGDPIQLAKEGLTSATNEDNDHVQTLLQIKRLKVSVTSLKKAGLELIKSCVQSTVSLKYGGKGLLKRAEQKGRQLKNTTVVGRNHKTRRPDKHSHKQVFPIPFLVDSQQSICIVCNNEINPRSSKSHLITHTVSELLEAKEKYLDNTAADSRKIKMQYTWMSVLKCELCCEQCHNIVGYRKHLLDKHRESREILEKLCFCCSLCKEIFISRSALMIHLRDFHKIFTQCPICNLNVETQELFGKHVDEMHSKCFKGDDKIVLEYSDGFFCKICGFCCQSIHTISSHCAEAHSENVSLPASYPCYICKQKYDSKKSLKSHMLKIHGDRSFCCELCGKQFNNATALKNHRRRHTTQPNDKDKVECKKCGKTFANQSTYKVHYLATHEKKRYACNICGKTFTTASNVCTHKMLVCEKEKAIPKACPICGKVFANYMFLTHHKANIHKYGNQEETACHLCKKSFKDAFALYTHNIRDHGRKTNPIQLICAICQKTCPNDRNFLIHWRMHREEKPYKCNLCDTPFRYQYQFYAHRKNEHADELESAKLITDTELDDKIREDWKNAHAFQLADWKNARASQPEETRKNITEPPNNSVPMPMDSIGCDQNGDFIEMDSNKIISQKEELSNATGKEDSDKSYVDFSRANVPESRAVVHEELAANSECESIENCTETNEEEMPSIQENTQEHEILDGDSDLDYPLSPKKYSGNESNSKEKRDIFYEDPFEKRLMVKLERLKLLATGPVVQDALPDNFRAIYNQATDESITEQIPLLQDSPHDKEMLDAGFDFDHPPSPFEHYYSDCEDVPEEKKPDIFGEDPFENRLIVKLERLTECLVCDKYFSEPDLYEKHLDSKSHRAATRANKREAILIVKQDKRKRKRDERNRKHDEKERKRDEKKRKSDERKGNQENEKKLDSDEKYVKKFISCVFCMENLESLKRYKEHSLQHKKLALCLLCTEKLPTIQELVDHYAKEHNGKNIVKCEICDEAFLEYQGQHLQEHMRDAHDRKISKASSDVVVLRSCDICGKRIRTKKSLWIHLLSHNEDKYKCVNCEEELKCLTELECHYNEAHNGEMPFSCENCAHKFSTRFQLNVHEKEDHSVENEENCVEEINTKPKELFPCPFCDEKFSAMYKYVPHVRKHKKIANCLLCEDKFHSVQKLVDHYTSNHDGEKIVKCKICDKGFLEYRDRSLREHMTRFHGRKWKNRKKTILCSCEICGEKFKNQTSLRVHLISHNETKHKCVYCADEFNQIELESHYEEAHNGEIPFSCQECEQKFSTEERLELHEKEFHSNDPVLKEFICDECGKEFYSTKDFKDHKLSHLSLEDRPKLFCEFCGKSFLRPYKLTIHVREHTGEKPYPCTLCDKAFISSDVLKQHIDSVHSRKGHTCEICGKSYNSSKYLRRHIKERHSGEVHFFSCELCPEKFSKPEILKRHVARLHDPSRPFACDQCSCRFNHKSNLNLHIKGVHEKMDTV